MKFALALELGIGTVGELEDRMSSKEFTEWLQFFEWRKWYLDNDP